MQDVSASDGHAARCDHGLAGEIAQLTAERECSPRLRGVSAQSAGSLFKKVLLSLGRTKAQADEVPAPTSEAR